MDHKIIFMCVIFLMMCGSWIAIYYLSMHLYYPKSVLENGVVTSSEIHEIYNDNGVYYCNYITINYNVNSCIYETCEYDLDTAIKISNEYYVGYKINVWISSDNTCDFKYTKKIIGSAFFFLLLLIFVCVIPTFAFAIGVLLSIFFTLDFIITSIKNSPAKIIITTYSPIINPYSKDINNIDINNIDINNVDINNIDINNVDINNVDLTNLENDLKVIPL